MPEHASKAAYVKKQKQDRRHECHWPGCKEQCPPAMWGCRRHWFSLPKDLRDLIWAAYVPGQERRLDPSRDYLKAAKEVQAWIYENNCVMSEDHHVSPHRSCVLR